MSYLPWASMAKSIERHKSRSRRWSPTTKLNRRLSEALEALPAQREALETARQLLRRRQEDVKQDGARRDQLARELESMPQVESALDQVQKQYQALEKQRQDALVQRGRFD